MVKVASNQFTEFSHQDDPRDWLARLPMDYSEKQQGIITNAFSLAQKVVVENEEAEQIFKQGLVIADILVQLSVDADTLATAIIFPFYQEEYIDLDTLTSVLTKDIAHLCKGVSAMESIRAIQQKQQDAKPLNDSQHIDNLRRMLLAMVDDVRLVLIKLAERLSVLREVKNDSEAVRRLVATEVKDIYAPLANRLGVGQLKWEMEDLSFRYLQPANYKKIAKSLDERRVDRERFVARVLDKLTSELEKVHIKADVMGRAKHIFSIWKKMQRKGVGFEEIYDVRAVRILVEHEPQCYAALGIVHSLWKHIPKEFDDYIATPKENGYRSLHTAVVGPEGKTLEVQIRTQAMHQESELGVAAHWRYKEGRQAQQSGFEAKIAWLRQLIEWQEEVADANQFLEEFRSEVVEDRIYVFTPQGKVIDLPLGATPLDFAYHVHTDIGHRCRGAKVNGRIVPLTQALNTGEQIEVLTSKSGGPSRDWLSPHSGYIRSSRARSKIHQWFRHQDKDKNAAAGRTILEKDLQRYGFENVDLDKLSKRFNYHAVDDLYAGIGAGDIGMTQVLNSIRSLLDIPRTSQQKVAARPQTKKSTSSDDIHVQGVGNLLTKIAGCCKPVPGERIIGYITQGRGVVIHRQDCSYVLSVDNDKADRLIEVNWGEDTDDVYDVDIKIRAYDRKGLLRDITTVFANEKVSVESFNTNLNKKLQTTDITATVNIENTEKLYRVIAHLSQIQNVIEVQRKQ
ncbi:GTP diphosphokinase [Pleionea sp. CnH1-48]|uniref:GTP diphosphokinase n=1 Tax=Pleionea sp. CnH1-48 TaxID=2954494 RepID=UPI002097F126|nr:GTP diphosphokinase [Pleionea sp. CnH1-48]MCO7223890.1 GTP diphosphokinase [Pleionea sp. CnH1-48]